MSALLDDLAPAQTRHAPWRCMKALAFLLACAAASICACAAAPADADSIVYIHEGNIWLAGPDGSGQYQVTFDAGPSSPYESPSESDDGTILAVRRLPGPEQRNQLFRMTQSGQLLNPPIDTPAPGPAGALEAKISPDGTLAAYWFVTTVFAPCAYCVELASRTLLSHSDRFTNYEEVGTPDTGIEPSWISSSTVLLANSNSTQWYYTLGMHEAAIWFESTKVGFPETLELLSDGEVAPNGDRMAVVFGDSRQTLWMLPLNGAPPTPPGPARECFVMPKGKFVDPTWSSNGATLYWQEDDGVWAGQIPSASNCEGEPALIVPGAREPDASPAAANPGPRPGCGNPGNPVACPGPAPGSSSTPTSTAQPTPACTTCGGGGPSVVATEAALRSLLKAGTAALGKRALYGLRARHHISLSFKAPAAGTLAATLAAHGVVLARGRHVFGAPGRAALALALTAKGRGRLARAHALRGTLTVGFVPSGARSGTSLHTTVTLH